MELTKQVKYQQIVVFIGFMGSGKSTLGARFARARGARFVDLDAEIVRRASGRSVAQIFEQEGEAGFRRRETAALRVLLSEIGKMSRGGRRSQPGRRPGTMKARQRSGGADCRTSCFLALGGGTVLRAENRRLLRRAGVCVVWIDPSWSVLRARLKKLRQMRAGSPGNRPLLAGKSWAAIRALWSARRRHYAQVTSVRVRVGNTDRVAQVLGKIQSGICKKSKIP